MSRHIYESVEMDTNLPMRILHFSPSNEMVQKQLAAQPFDVDSIHFIPPHWHRSLELTYIVKGKLRIQTGDKEAIYSDGDFFVINSGDIHEVSNLPTDNAAEVICLLISYDYLEELYPGIDKIRFDMLTTKETYAELRELFLQIIALHHQQKEFDYFLIQAQLLNVLYFLFEHHQTDENIPTIQKHVKTQKLYKQILEYIHLNYQKELSLAIIADEFHFSREHFSRLFKEAFGKTFIEYLNDYRLYQAFPDIVQSNKTIEIISCENGFPSSKALITLFKKKYQETPIKYRHQNKVIIVDHLEAEKK